MSALAAAYKESGNRRSAIAVRQRAAAPKLVVGGKAGLARRPPWSRRAGDAGSGDRRRDRPSG